MSLRVTCVAAARPNFMKVKPVLDALEARGHQTTLVHTGQHYDAAMSDVFFADLGLRAPDVHLNVGSGSHARQTGDTMVAFEAHIQRTLPDWVVVVGDVNATLACALVAAKAECRLAHVEAGLRSGDWSMPEEVNRVATDRVSDLLLPPSEDAVDNLRAEGFTADQVTLVGNVMIDTLIANRERAVARPVLKELALERGAYALTTLHRPSNVDRPVVLDGLIAALGRVAEKLPVVWPVHPRVRARLTGRRIPNGLRLVDPAGYLDFLALQEGARLVLTDSGGVQEETTALGVPCLTLRTTTERPITVLEGTNRLVGVDPKAVVRAARDVLSDLGVVPHRRAIANVGVLADSH